MLHKLSFLLLLLIGKCPIFSQPATISISEYINTYKSIAIDEMKRSGIPASITLAQGIVESANGNSTLARKANNHFGIKCHKWNGRKFYQDDDAEDECFRKYESAEQSFLDHTNFLMNTARYNFLFGYKSDDYKHWAKGLKKAGYATSRQYATDLIKTIEENKLYVFDNENYTYNHPKNKDAADNDETAEVDIKRRKILERNRIKYVVADNADNVNSLTKELGLLSWELRKYNELTDKSSIKKGDIIYLQPKRWRASVGNDYHIVKQGDSMYSISQLYGIKIRKLYRKNRMDVGSEPETGQKIWLRKRKPA